MQPPKAFKYLVACVCGRAMKQWHTKGKHEEFVKYFLNGETKNPRQPTVPFPELPDVAIECLAQRMKVDALAYIGSIISRRNKFVTDCRKPLVELSPEDAREFLKLTNSSVASFADLFGFPTAKRLFPNEFPSVFLR